MFIVLADMPSVSEKQAKTMRAAAHSHEFAKKMGIPQSVAREYMHEDMKKSGTLSSGKKKKRKRTLSVGD